MKVGIVGSEEKYWTPRQKIEARKAITMLLSKEDILISGRCHKGGVDIWAEDWADTIGAKKIIFPAEKPSWYYYKKRNKQIAKECDILVDIEPGERRSGGYWTLEYAKSIGKTVNHVRII